MPKKGTPCHYELLSGSTKNNKKKEAAALSSGKPASPSCRASMAVPDDWRAWIQGQKWVLTLVGLPLLPHCDMAEYGAITP